MVIKAIVHFQKGGNTQRSHQYLLKVIDDLKKRGLYQFAITILQTEMKQNKQISYWLIWHCAHCQFIIGNIWESFQILHWCVDRAVSRIINEKKNDDSTAFFIKSMMLLAEIVECVLSYGEGIEILTTAIARFSPEDLEFNLKSHLMSVLSWFYLKKGLTEEALNINQNILAEEFASNEQGKGVAYTRVGVIQLGQNNFTEAEKCFNAAIENFRAYRDKRGLAWALQFETLCRAKHNTALLPVDRIIETMAHCKEADLFDKDYIQWLLYFEPIVEDVCKRLLDDELYRVAQKEQQMINAFEQVDLKDVLKQLLEQIKITEKDFNYRVHNKQFIQCSLPSDSKHSCLYQSGEMETFCVYRPPFPKSWPYCFSQLSKQQSNR